MIGEMQYADAFLLLFIGMGPIKALVAYLSATQDASPELQRRVARKVVVTAFSVAIIIQLLGVVFLKVLHFEIPALRIAGGIILLLLALHMVIGGGKEQKATGEPVDEAALMRMAISPLAIPLLLNPIGIVSLTVFSVQVTELLAFTALVAMLAVVAIIDYVILASAHRMDRILTSERILIAEKLLGIMLAALAVQLIVNGLAEFGIITLIGGGH